MFNFASAADKAKWRAAGSPKLGGPAGEPGFTRPVTNNYSFGGYSTNEGVIKVSITSARKLPTTPGKLDAMLRGQWNSLSPEQRRDGAVPTYAHFVFQMAEALLTGPVTPGTRAAVYELLARQPGLTTATNVTDPLGRVGTAIGDESDGFLVISPATAEVLDLTSAQVRAGATIPATGNLTEAFITMHWTDRLP